MKITGRLITYIITIAIGAILLTLAVAGVLDSFWSGMGASLLTISILRLAQLYLYKTDKAYQCAIGLLTDKETYNSILSNANAK